MGLHFLRGAGADELRETASEGFTLPAAVWLKFFINLYPSFNSSPKQGEAWPLHPNYPTSFRERKLSKQPGVQPQIYLYTRKHSENFYLLPGLKSSVHQSHIQQNIWSEPHHTPYLHLHNAVTRQVLLQAWPWRNKNQQYNYQLFFDEQTSQNSYSGNCTTAAFLPWSYFFAGFLRLQAV